MGDSEDEFRPRVPPGRPRDAGGTTAAGPPPLRPDRGPKRGSARKRRGGARPGGPGGKRPRAKGPPPLLLQGPETARRGLEARAALLLLPPEAPAAPRTPPLPASRWGREAAGGPLWELSSLATPERRGGAVEAGRPGDPRGGSGGRPRSASPERPESSAEPEGSPSGRGEAGALQDLLQLAGEGLTFTQWSLDTGRRLEPAEQEQMSAVQQKAFTQLLEKQQQQQQQQLSRKSSHETFPLDSLVAAFKEMVNNPHLSDIQIQVDSGEVFYAHMFILYARCPQLLQFVDQKRFVVAEEGEVGAARVLLHDAPGDAVALLLKYLYTAEHFIPQYLLSDVVDLAIRFGVKELAVLCEGQPSEEISIEKSAEDKDRVGNFEEILKSMWQDEDETAARSVCRDEISDSTNEWDLEEIYEFMATQHRMTSDEVRKEKIPAKCRHDEVEMKIGQDSGSCPKKRLETPTRCMTIKESETKCDLESSKLKTCIARMEKDLKKYSVEFQQDFKEIVSLGASSRKECASEIHLELAGESSHGSHLERSATQFSVSEMKCGSLWEQNINIAKDKMTARLLQAPSEALQRTLSRDPEAPFSLVTSASQPDVLEGPPSQNVKQGNISRKGGAPLGRLEKSGAVNPHDLTVMRGHIVVLDSDEELEQEAEQKQAEATLGLSEQQSRHKVSPATDALNCWSPSPPQQDPGKVGDGLGALICHEAQSLGECHRPLNLGSFWEGLGWSEGRTLVVPETPLPAWNSLDDVEAEEIRLNSFLEKQGVHEAQTEPPTCSCEPLPMPSSPSLLEMVKRSKGQHAAESDVVVVDDGEEEQEGAVAPRSRVTVVEPLAVITANARHLLRTPVHTFEMQDNRPVAAAKGAANPAATFRFGVGGSPLHNSWNWPGEVSDSNETPPARSDLACQARDVSRATPLLPLPPFSSMDTPELKKELSRFGVRALPKRQMILKLKEIFQFTHQEAVTNCRKKNLPVATSSFQNFQNLPPHRLLRGSPTTTNRTDFSEGRPQRPEAGLVSPEGAALPANRLTGGDDDDGGPIPTTARGSAGTAGGRNEAGAASQSSSMEFKTSMLAERGGNVPASQIAAGGEGQKLEILKHYIHSNPSLCQQILFYQPIELSALHAELKQSGIRIALDKLLDFLDANCITFTTAEARREKRQLRGSKKKGQR